MTEASFTIRKGLDVALAGKPVPTIEAGPPIDRVAILGADLPGVRPRLAVREGQGVRIGQTLFSDRRHHALRFTAPASGVVSQIVMDEHNRLRLLVIGIEGNEAQPFPVLDLGAIATAKPDDIEELLLASGLWSTLRTRPFGNIPTPGTQPADLFVTAVDTQPLAAPPEAVIAEHSCEFALGLAALARLTPGRLYLCQGPGPDLPRPDDGSIVVARFDGPHPAGLPGTHIHLLAPVSLQRTVWHVDYPDVIALGGLLTTGAVPVERTIALAGPLVRRPRLLRTRLGASVEAILRGELHAGPSQTRESHLVITGSVLCGRAITQEAAFLGARHRQICVLPASDSESWVVARTARPRAFVPISAYDRVLPMDILPAPLLRALLIEDDDAAVALGALELGEDDLALLSFVCPSRQDYGALLRAALSRIEAAQAI